MESWCSPSPLLALTLYQATGAQGLCKARSAHQEGHIPSSGSPNSSICVRTQRTRLNGVMFYSSATIQTPHGSQ